MSIFTPDNFKADWYGYATNQISHAAVGLGMAAVASFGWFAVFGEYPYRVPLAIALVLVYVLVIEVRQRGSFWADGLEDTIFVGYGVALILGTLHEVERSSLTLMPDIKAIFTVFGLIGFHLAVGVGIRVRQACRRRG